MKRIAILLTAVTIVALASCVSVPPPVIEEAVPETASSDPSPVPEKGVEPEEEAPFFAGAAETQITSTRDREKVHQDMYARVLILSDGSNRAAIVTLDVTGLGSGHMHNIRKGIEKATGIPDSHITVNGSHTHSAPRLSHDTETIWEDGLTYGERLTRQCVDLAVQANNELRPCWLMHDRQLVQIGFNRRLMRNDNHVIMAISPYGAVAPWTDILGMYEVNTGRRIAVLFTYAAHPTITQFSDVVSSDYPGSAVAQLKSYLTGGGKNEMTGILMFGQGCGGNINAFPLRGGPEACDASGGKLAAAVTRATLKEAAPGPIKAASLTLTLPYQDPPPVEEVEKAIEEDPNDKRRQKLLQTAREGSKPRSCRYPMRAMAIGPDICILSLPMETFVEYQLFADENSPFEHTIVLAYCNYGGGYVATAADYELGARAGYEASPYGCALNNEYALALSPSVEKTIKDGILELLGDLKSKME